MSLTLFPITALLLLLSGMSTPAHAADCKMAIAVLGKQFLAAALQNPAQKPTSHAQHYTACACNTHAARHIRTAQCGLAGPQITVRAGLLTRKQYRTRFGFAEGAYLAVGPPATRLAADLG